MRVSCRRLELLFRHVDANHRTGLTYERSGDVHIAPRAAPEVEHAEALDAEGNLMEVGVRGVMDMRQSVGEETKRGSERRRWMGLGLRHRAQLTG